MAISTKDLNTAKDDKKTGFRQKIESELIKSRHHMPLLEILQKILMCPLKIIQRALHQEREHRRARSIEIGLHLENARDAIKGKDVKVVAEQVKIKLQDDLEINRKMDAAIKAQGFMPGALDKGKDTSYYVSHNKNCLILPGASKFVEEHFMTTFNDGKIPKGYSFEYRPEEMTLIGNNPISIWGNPKGTFFTTAILTTSLVCHNVSQLQSLESISKNKFSIDNSVLIYRSKLPVKFNLSDIDARVMKFSCAYSFKNFNGIAKGVPFIDGYSCVHGGYVYGGIRNTREMGPYEDCTSWTSKVTECPIIYTSRELADYQNGTLNKGRAKALTSVYELKKIKDPQRDIEAGSLYWQPGHTALILGFISDAEQSQIVAQAFTRNIEAGQDGFGIQLFPYSPDKKCLIFSLKGRAAEAMTLSSIASTESILISHTAKKKN